MSSDGPAILCTTTIYSSGLLQSLPGHENDGGPATLAFTPEAMTRQLREVRDDRVHLAVLHEPFQRWRQSLQRRLIGAWF
ncbi:hypothetical protein [Paraburkholderia aspalathi]|uniref:hypothetical protein n=1 Tax=Paraburkholderia aspalathi TaxID=1324617 RepID=UPI0038B99061